MIRIKNIIFLFIFALCILSILRFILFVVYFDDFSILKTIDIIMSFLMGIRVDSITLSTAFILPCFFLFLPFRFVEYIPFQFIVYSYIYISISIIVAFLICDILYFEHVHRHIANEIFYMKNDYHILLDMIKINYDKIFYFFIFELTMLLFFKKIINFNVKVSFCLNQFVLLFFVIIVFYIGMRSNFSSKPFGLADAFVTNKTESGNLAINGIFSVAKNFKNQTIYHFYEDNKARDIVQDALISDEFIFMDENYPLLRRVKNLKVKKYNVVIIMLESWSAKYVDSFTHNGLGVTKNLDKFANNGLKFINFFANGQRSVHGITALLTGLPVLPYFEYLGHGLEFSRLTYLANSAKNEGYATLAMQSSNRGSYRVDAVARLSGFDAYYGAEDYPVLKLESSGKRPEYGAWDNDMFSFYFDKINTLKEPFLAFTFTSSTHMPFVSPGKKWEKYPHDDNHIYGFLNTLNYADEALGSFMQKAEKAKWFSNTIFIFLADHALGFGSTNEASKLSKISMKKDRVLEYMRIPLVVYAPKLFKPQEINKVASQADIFPSLSHFLGWKTPLATTSNSIFSRSSKPFVLFSNGYSLAYVDANGYIRHNLKNTLENTLDEGAKKKLLSFYQFLSTALKANKISPI